MNNKGNIFIGLLATIAFVGIIVGIVWVCFQWEYGNEQIIECTIKDKWIKKYDEEDLYLVSCGDEVYKIEDLFYKGKFNSTNIYANLEKSKKYRIKVTGYRFGYLSSYQNINSYEEVEE